MNAAQEAGIRAAWLTLCWVGAVNAGWLFTSFLIADYRRGHMSRVRLWANVGFYILCVTVMGVALLSATWQLWLRVQGL